ncbi:MAG: 23S rRNA (adenine(1618)-N(6))-methyltransferase RlmF [Acidobacteriota bacterium]
MIRRSRKAAMHARNRFRDGYDFDQLVTASPTLAPFVVPNPYGDLSIDYSNPDAVKALNRALLIHGYGLEEWDVPPGYLCPPIPGRSDYVHYLADLLATGDPPVPPHGRSVTVLDIGVGANCVYPLIGAREYGWAFVGSETDPVAYRSAAKLAAANSSVADLIECRLQTLTAECFTGVIRPGETFSASMCNPPFHASPEEAAAAARRKTRNLGRATPGVQTLNFGGQPGELWCDGGELAFVRRMIIQSADVRERCRWFTTLVSNSEHLTRLYAALRQVSARTVRTIGMAQGQKQSRILAWSFEI